MHEILKSAIARDDHFNAILNRASKKFTFESKDEIRQFKKALSGSNIDFEKLASFDEFNFWHDIYGIHKHFDYEKNRCTSHFSPRSTRRKNEN